MPENSKDSELAANIIRAKVQRAYGEEPPVTNQTHSISHRAYFDKLVASGASAQEVQKAWHEYYQSLDREEKTKVWEEYYQLQSDNASNQSSPSVTHQTPGSVTDFSNTDIKRLRKSGLRRRIDKTQAAETVADLKAILTDKFTTKAQKLKNNHHTKPLISAFIAGFLFLALNYNQMLVASYKNYVMPSRSSNSPLILGSDQGVSASSEPKIIIPKINLEIPVVYDEPSVEEPKVQKALERGAVHYADTSAPGESGNGVIVGHSSNNVLNNGKFKFAFVLLNRLEVNDTFVLNYDSKRYIYKVYDRRIVKPNDVSVLGAAAKSHTITLITCDPPGSSVNRLIVQGEQISPEPKGDAQSQVADKEPSLPKQVPGNAPSLFNRFMNWFL